MGSPRGWDQADGAPWQAMGGGQGARAAAGENEGGWSVPEAAGARGGLLGCACPARGSFRAATPAGVGKERDGTREGEAGSSASPYRGPPPDRSGQGSGWRGARALPGPCPPGTSLEDSPRQMGQGPWLERERCPEEHAVPGGSRTCAVLCTAVTS